MKRLIVSLALAALCACALAQGPLRRPEVPPGYQEVLTIQIDIKGAQTVMADSVSVTMIPFAGSVDCANFKGEVLPTGVDTQVGKPSGRTLSARYMLVGKDLTGADCHIFIERQRGPLLPEHSHPPRPARLQRRRPDDPDLLPAGRPGSYSQPAAAVGSKMPVHFYRFFASQETKVS